VSVAVVLPPAAKDTEAGSIAELIVAVSPVSVFVRLNVSLAQPTSLFVIARVYCTLPAFVDIVFDVGAEKVIVGAKRVHGVTLIDVCTSSDEVAA